MPLQYFCNMSPFELTTSGLGAGSDSQLPVPCFATGDDKSGPHIVGFDPEILILQSMRQPKRLTIRGTDEGEYNVLVKGGEDLRLDERLEQLFAVANELLGADAACAKRSLRIHTYSVVPMSTTLGLIEWVDNTEPLLAVIKREATIEGKERSGVFSLQYEKFMGGHNYQGPPQGMYKKLYETTQNVEIRRVLERVEDLNSPFLLQRGVLRRAGNAECFLTMRETFARSYATLAIAGFVFGIGDRHLDNFLMNRSTGVVLPIDFGYAFGTQTHLAVPDIVPFRLTRQLTHVIAPLDGPYRSELTSKHGNSAGIRVDSRRGAQSSGVLKQTMVHTLSALRDRSTVLMSTLSVFAKEPLTNWGDYRKRVHFNSSDSGGGAGAAAKGSASPSSFASGNTLADDASTDEFLRQFAAQVSDVVRDKLNNVNPGHLVAEELNRNAKADTPFIKKVQEVVRGEKGVAFRASDDRQCSSVREQVDCLVDLATDPTVLGRMWIGWRPWI